MPREKYGFLLLDFPSDHEIDGILATECDTIRAILYNRDLGRRVKMLRATSANSIEKFSKYQYQAQFVHLAGHVSINGDGVVDGIGLIGGTIPWKKVAEIIVDRLTPLENSEQRVMCISCCHSREAFKAISKYLEDRFTGYYYFHRKTTLFATAMTVWSMFYLKKNLARPHEQIVESINKFFGEKVLVFYSQEKRKEFF